MRPNMEPIKNFRGLPVVTGTQWPGIKYFSTTRLDGVNKLFNAKVNQNRLNGLLPSPPVWLNQVHGTAVHIADAAPKGNIPTADAAATIVPGRVVAVVTADCLPIVISSTNALVVGVVHAGWRGLANGVIENTVQTLKRLHPHPNTSWQAWIGPCIHQPAFEVGTEVRAAFLESQPNAELHFQPGKAAGKWHADLPSLASCRLKKAGVSIVEVSNMCTYENPDLFYSYRRNNVTGRQATLAWISVSDLLG